MTGYTVNTGSTTKFSDGWDRIFAGATGAERSAKKPAKAAGKVPAKAKAGVKKSPAAKTGAGKAAAKTVKSKRAVQTTRTSGKR